MANELEKTVRSYLCDESATRRFIRVEEATKWISQEYIKIEDTEFTKLLAIAAEAFYKLPRIELIHKERLNEYMKHIYKVPGTNKHVIKKYVRIGEGSIIYSIGHHRFIEMARAAGATYKINEGTGGTVLINLEIFDQYMEQFRQEPRKMRKPLFEANGGDRT